MSYEIIRGPFILMETVEMLYKYVNNISFLNIASRLRLLRGGMDAEMQRRMERLQKLTQEVCGGLDPNDPVLRDEALSVFDSIRCSHTWTKV